MKRNPVCVSNSELTTLRNCAWKHHLRFELGLDPVGGADRTGARSVGALVHLGIAEIYRTVQRMQLVRLRPTQYQLHAVAQDCIKKACAEAEEETGLFVGEEADAQRVAEKADQETALKCLDLFVEHIALPTFEKYSVVGVEVPFKVPILTQAGKRSGDELEGVIDIVLRDNQLGTIVCGENKTTSSDASTYELQLATDPQIPLYIYALQQMFGELVRGQVLLNVIRKAYPSEPKTNLDGTVSVAECDTTRDVYGRALENQSLPDWWMKARDAFIDPANAGKQKVADAMTKADERWTEVKAKQQARLDGLPDISRFVSQFEEHISSEHVQRAALDAWNGARLIRQFRRELLIPWRNGSACKAYGRLCEFHDACVEGIVEAGELLVKRDHRHHEVVEARAYGDQKLVTILEQLA